MKKQLRSERHHIIRKSANAKVPLMKKENDPYFNNHLQASRQQYSEVPRNCYLDLTEKGGQDYLEGVFEKSNI